MNFRYLTVFVADVARTLAFYDAAFGLRATFVHDRATTPSSIQAGPSSPSAPSAVARGRRR